ncbi:DUF1937 family protein [Desulfobacter postgatei]|uniref:DUF1937 family protein n=1 Tax=Desulfobacter postgatei TaxID=2293 RepID=UPI002FD8FA7B
MKRIYVAGKYSADNVIEGLQNIGKGERAAAMLFQAGYAPFCPWSDAVYCKLLCDDNLVKEWFYKASLAWLEVSDAMLVISGAGDGGGVDMEIEVANKLDIPVFHSLADLHWYFNGAEA